MAATSTREGEGKAAAASDQRRRREAAAAVWGWEREGSVNKVGGEREGSCSGVGGGEKAEAVGWRERGTVVGAAYRVGWGRGGEGGRGQGNIG